MKEPSPSPQEWAAAWLRNSYERTTKAFWAWEDLTDAAYDDPERAWQVILQLVRDAQPDRYGYIGAGPLKHLIRAHAQAFIDRIEAQAASDPRFREELGQVSVNTLEHRPEIVARLVAASGGVIEPYALDYDEAERKYLRDQDGA